MQPDIGKLQTFWQSVENRSNVRQLDKEFIMSAAMRKKTFRRYLRLFFILWAVVSVTYLANSVRTQGVSDTLLASTDRVDVINTNNQLFFMPGQTQSSALIFICGSGITPEAYAPLLHPVAELGYPVFIVGLPWRFAPLDSHKQQALKYLDTILKHHTDISRWVIAGHSLGGALTAQFAAKPHSENLSYVLIGTTHPKQQDLSHLQAEVSKVFATQDGIAPADKILLNRKLLPASTHWIRIDGGNHSQFGHYGHQLFDGHATISREQQQQMTRDTLIAQLMGV
ncbi:alpha/beta hydrolase [Neptunicella marina]|uniref:Alpha/beta hydrolase fold-5 domain-containing protein n=1 Tax=Neptunicella marina TaxID=2125989 RepID=A0A8J6IQS5_9ALTE|nr:alpha/beta hydrolase [Neptunicella marina]MBC3764794.1 hypothetical protein [Neptunicella marina]